MRPEPSTGNAVDSRDRALGEWLAFELSPASRRWLGAACAVAAAFGILGLLWDPAVAGLGLLATAAAATAFARPHLLGPFVAVLLPAGGAVHVLGAQVVPLEAVVGGGAIGYLARAAVRRETVRFRPVDAVFGVLLVFIAISMFGPVDDSDRFRELLVWGALAVVFHAIAVHLHERRALRYLLLGLGAAALVEAAVALYEYLDRWSERFSALGGAIVYPLPEGTLGHPNALGQFFVLALLGVLALTLGEQGPVRWFGFIALAAGSLALVVTFSRASWVAFAVGVSVYLLERRTRRAVLLAGCLSIAGAATLAVLGEGAIGARVSSLLRGETGELYEFRLELIERASRVAGDHPLTGFGHFEEVGVYAGRPDLATHPHNLLLGLAVFFGIPAAVAFAALVLFALKGAWAGYRAGGPLTLPALGFVAVLVALLVGGLFEYPFWNTQLTVLIALVLAVAVGLEREVPRSSSSGVA